MRCKSFVMSFFWLAAATLLAQSPHPAPRNLKIAMIAKSSANFVFLSAQRGAEDAARALSQKHGVSIEVSWLTPAREDAAVQAERITQAVRDGAKAVLISCSDAAQLTGPIDAAVDAGVAVMTFDSDAPGSKRFAFYGADDGDLGDKVMTDLAELLGGQGQVAILAGSPNAPNLRARAEGVRKAALRYKKIEVVDSVNHIETPQDAALAVLRVDAARPKLAGWAMVGGWPLFRSSQSANLVAELQERKLKVIAVDALPDQLNYVERGLVSVLWAQPTYDWGKVGVETIVDKVLLGKSVPSKLPMQLVRVSRQNLASWTQMLRRWGFTGLPDETLKSP
ncbi:MAG TPA: substrate-binding domain-containing protein [Vicinamibacteria bacterium]|jgi:ribose transport system substrate-binding protein|nr:substrate-binding domain-containing protein [Vicinamibacteria bacterium]